MLSFDVANYFSTPLLLSIIASLLPAYVISFLVMSHTIVTFPLSQYSAVLIVHDSIQFSAIGQVLGMNKHRTWPEQLLHKYAGDVFIHCLYHMSPEKYGHTCWLWYRLN